MQVATVLPNDNRAVVPPDPLPNSEVKHSIADGSVGFPHVRVGHCWVLIQGPEQELFRAFLCL